MSNDQPVELTIDATPTKEEDNDKVFIDGAFANGDLSAINLVVKQDLNGKFESATLSYKDKVSDVIYVQKFEEKASIEYYEQKLQAAQEKQKPSWYQKAWSALPFSSVQSFTQWCVIITTVYAIKHIPTIMQIMEMRQSSPNTNMCDCLTPDQLAELYTNFTLGK
ncbi:MAG: hypothetical protein OEY79_02990 [Anaplasmataceae bacterium]|nr:hypothetical protein [Anaplasmataceae bacterium]